MKVFAFTGHRPEKIGGYSTTNNPTYDKVKDWLEFQVEYLVRRHEDVTFISGGALGVDQMAAEAVLHIKDKYVSGKHSLMKTKDNGEEYYVQPNIHLLLAFPCRNYDKKWPEHSKRQYAAIRFRADALHHVHDGEYPGAWCLQARNEYMVDGCDGLIAVYDGIQDPNKGSGTRNCMLYAWKKGVPIIQLDISTWEEKKHYPRTK